MTVGILSIAHNPQSFTFQGNPNVITSAVDVATNGIVAHRITATTPAFIHVSASGILCTGTNSNGNPVRPYEDLMYVWTGGNPSSADTIIDPTNTLGTVVSTDTQYGPEAVFCYRTAGTYTVTLTVYYQTSTGVYVSTSATQSITVSAWSGTTRYLDSAAPDGGDGTTKATAWNNNTPITTINGFTTFGANRRLSVALGTSYTIATGNSLQCGGTDVSGCRLDTLAGNDASGGQYISQYSGSTGKPVFLPQGNRSGQQGGVIFPFTHGVAATNDNVISNIKVYTTGASTSGGGICANTASNFGSAGYNFNYIDTCDVLCDINTTAYGSVIFIGIDGNPNPAAGWGLWKCALIEPIILTNGISKHGQGLDSEVQNWFFVLGCTFVGSGLDANKDHHIYDETDTHSLYRWNYFGETGLFNAQRSMCINKNALPFGPVNGTTGGLTAQYHLFADNCMGAITTPNGGQSCQSAHDLSTANNEPAWGLYYDVVTERNFIPNLTASCWEYFNQGSHTIRNNNIYNVGGITALSQPQLGANHLQFYQNKIYFDNTNIGNKNSMPNYFQEEQETAQAISSGSPCALTTNRVVAMPVGTAINITASTAPGLSPGVYYIATNLYVNGPPQTWSSTLSSSPTLTPLVNTTGSGTCTFVTMMDKMHPQTFQYNICWDNRTSPGMWTLATFAKFGPSGNNSIIDNNQYYVQSLSSTPFFSTPTGSVNFATWQAAGLDLHSIFSTTGTPSWSSPSTGIFK